MIEIYNSLSRKKEPLSPLEAGRVRMYVCGMTVYDYCHIGHARVLVVFDTIVRYLRARGFEVRYVRNITDIDDKIIQRAAERGQAVDVLTREFIGAMHDDAAALGVLPPDKEPRATASMAAIIAMIEALVEKGLAYQTPGGDVYYSISKFPGYGRLSGRRLEDLRAGARVEVDESKRDPLDFVLWKTAKPGEPQWDSPWGPGRPGWHIECSAMSTECLGNHFDIHGGGLDLQFPHHENEIAQSEGATGEPFVNIWMHNGFVRVDDEKMSKSLGNFFTVREVLEHFDPEVVRYFILSSHYRSPLNYSNRQLEDAQRALTTLYTALRGMETDCAAGLGLEDRDNADSARFMVAMDDDFNTADALAVLFDLARRLNRARGENPSRAQELACRLRALGQVLGLLERPAEAYFQGGPAAPGVDVDRIEALIQERAAARRRKDWAESDRIRDRLQDLGIGLEDGPEGTVWRRL